MSALTKIQNELKAPKSQYNLFGKFNYRSCEDILEAVKPLLLKYDSTLILNDSVMQIGNRYYVCCTATIETPDGIRWVNGFAREPEAKKGMDESQITGSTSSYARKYALSALLAIDDSKDADTMMNGKDLDKKYETPKGKPEDYKIEDAATQVKEAFQGTEIKDRLYDMSALRPSLVFDFNMRANDHIAADPATSAAAFDKFILDLAKHKSDTKDKTLEQIKESIMAKGTFDKVWEKYLVTLLKA